MSIIELRVFYRYMVKCQYGGRTEQQNFYIQRAALSSHFSVDQWPAAHKFSPVLYCICTI